MVEALGIVERILFDGAHHGSYRIQGQTKRRSSKHVWFEPRGRRDGNGDGKSGFQIVHLGLVTHLSVPDAAIEFSGIATTGKRHFGSHIHEAIEERDFDIQSQHWPDTVHQGVIKRQGIQVFVIGISVAG